MTMLSGLDFWLLDLWVKSSNKQISFTRFPEKEKEDYKQGRLTGKVGPDTKSRLEAGFLGDHLVLQTVLDIEGVREDDDLLVCDAFCVVEIAHHLHEVRGIAGILANAGVNLCVCFLVGLEASVVDGCCNGGFNCGLALDVGLACGS